MYGKLKKIIPSMGVWRFCSYTQESFLIWKFYSRSFFGILLVDSELTTLKYIHAYIYHIYIHIYKKIKIVFIHTESIQHMIASGPKFLSALI